MPYNPCGMIMDVVRTCYARPTRFFRDNDLAIPILWYRAKPDAKFFPVPHRVNSLFWYRAPWEAEGVGEIFNTPHAYSKGFCPPTASGQHWFGALQDHIEGAKYDSSVNVELDIWGIPKGCGTPDPSWIVTEGPIPPPIGTEGGEPIAMENPQFVTIFCDELASGSALVRTQLWAIFHDPANSFGNDLDGVMLPLQYEASSPDLGLTDAWTYRQDSVRRDGDFLPACDGTLFPVAFAVQFACQYPIPGVTPHAQFFEAGRGVGQSLTTWNGVLPFSAEIEGFVAPANPTPGTWCLPANQGPGGPITITVTDFLPPGALHRKAKCGCCPDCDENRGEPCTKQS